MKTINITNISLKEFAISKSDGKISIGLYYSLLDENGKEYDQKRDTIKNDELTTQQKDYINNILSALEVKIKQREGI